MKRLLLGVSALALVFGLVLNSHALTLSAADGTWSNPVGGIGNQYANGVSVLYGNGLQDQIRWGSPAGNTLQSGLGFTGIAPPAQTFGIGDAFEIGQLQHFNFPINSGTAVSGVKLGIALAFSDPSGLNGTFNFNFGVNETPNNTGGSPGDDDIISLPSAFAPEAFNIGGIDYTLQLLGFGPSAASLISSFRSPEGGNNSTLLWGKITVPNSVPEPATMILFGIGLVGLVGFGRKKFSK